MSAAGGRFDGTLGSRSGDVIDRVGSEVDARTAELDRSYRFPDDLARRSVEAGLFQQLVTADLGGDADLCDWFRNGMRAAWWDGSFGWLITQGSAVSGLIVANAPKLAQRVLGSGPTATAGTNAGLLRLHLGDGPMSVDGTIPFASGCDSAVGMIALAGQRGQPNSRDTVRYVCAAAPEWEIVRDWDVVGLRGTGSHSLRANNMSIADDEWWPLDAPPASDDPLRVVNQNIGGAWPIAMSVAATQLGIAARALDESYPIVETKRPAPTFDVLDSRPTVRADLMEAEGWWFQAVRSSQAVLTELWETAVAGHDPSPRLRALLAVTAHLANRQSADIVDRVWRIVGTSALHPGSAIARCLRDVKPLLGHISCNPAVLGYAAARWRGEYPGHAVV